MNSLTPHTLLSLLKTSVGILLAISYTNPQCTNSIRFYWTNHIHYHTFECYIVSWNWSYRYSVHHQTSCFQLAFFTRFAKFVYISMHLILSQTKDNLILSLVFSSPRCPPNGSSCANDITLILLSLGSTT